MSSTGSIFTNVVNARAAGSKNRQTGYAHGGIYFPAHINAAGNKVAGKWEGNFFINKRGWTDDQGVFHEAKKITIRIVAWNGRNAAPGKGLADLLAKTISVGKEISCGLDINQFEKRHIINGVPVTGPDGKVLTYQSYNFTIKDELNLGPDADNLVAKEVANWASYPQASFISRPPHWNDQAHANYKVWEWIQQQRMALVYTGGNVYGYAQVMLPEGAQLINTAQPQTTQPVTTQPMTTQPVMQMQQMPQMQPVQPMMQPQVQVQPMPQMPTIPDMANENVMTGMQTGMPAGMPIGMQGGMQNGMPAGMVGMQPTAAATAMGATPI